MPAADGPRTFRAVDGAAVAYRLCRTDPPRPVVALLHGVASNMTRWSEFVARTTLGEWWDLLRLDLRGNGLSVHRGRLGMAEWCADLAGILDAEGYRRAVVVGHCLGANIGLEFATRYPEKTAGLVLIEPMLRETLTGPMRQVARLRPLFRLAGRLLRALNAIGLYRRELVPLDLEALDRDTRAAIAARATRDALLARYASPLLDLRTTPSVAYLEMLIAVSGRPPDLSAIRVPVLVLLATGSSFGDPAMAATALAALPDVRIVRLEARHWIPTEQPEAMRRVIEEWCAHLRGRCR